MASIKNIKKDINFLMEEVIETCFLHYHLNGENQQKRDEIDQMIEEVITLRNDLIFKLNNPDAEAQKMPSKQYYKGLLTQMLEKVDEIFDKLGSTQQ